MRRATTSPETEGALFGRLRALSRGGPEDRAWHEDIVQRLLQVLRKCKVRIPPRRRDKFDNDVRAVLRREVGDGDTLRLLRELLARYSAGRHGAAGGDAEEEGPEQEAEAGEAEEADSDEELSESWSGGTNKAAARAAIRGREAQRLRDLDSALRGLRVTDYLDIGSSEGRITEAVAAYLGLSKQHAVAVDIVPMREEPAAVQAFTFVRIEGQSLPFADGRFGLVTMFMSAHHFSHRAEMFAETRRVMKRGGTLIIREHDLTDARLAIFLDAVHALYMSVCGDEMAPDEFATLYADGGFATYMSRAEWTQVAEKAGFRFVRYLQPQVQGRRLQSDARAGRSDIFAAYYGVYQAR